MNSTIDKESLFLHSIEKLLVKSLKRIDFVKPAILYVATDKKVLTYYEIGYSSKSLLTALAFFQRPFKTNKIETFQEFEKINYRINLEEQGETQFYIGLITSQTEQLKEAQLFIEGLALGLSTSSEKNGLSKITINKLQNHLNFQLDFNKLIHVLRENVLDQPFFQSFHVLEKKGEMFVSLFEEMPDFEKVNDWLPQLAERENPFIIKEQYLVFPVRVDGEVVLLFMFSLVGNQDEMKKEIQQWLHTLVPLIESSYKLELRNRDNERRNILMQVTKKFHSTMDIDEILAEILKALKQANPSFEIFLLLSQEWKVKENLPVKLFKYGLNSDNSMAENAYVTGQIKVDTDVNEQRMYVYAPLRGKQGVYGVMEIQAKLDESITKEDFSFIEMLADTGGIALENAEINQQSQNLIKDLQLINQTTHQLNLNLRLSDTINYMTDQIIESLGAEEVGFFIFQGNGETVVLDGSSHLFSQSIVGKLDAFIRKIKKEKEPLFVGELNKETEINLPGFHSILVVPMMHSKELKGMALAVHRDAYFFTFHQFKLLQSLIHHSTLALTNAMLHEELEKLVITDHLTRLFSRNYLDERIQESLQTDGQGTFLLIDIDNFKKINDTFGHQVGDDIIIQVANVLKRNIREIDIAARWGGEELAVYLPRVPIDVGEKIAQRIVRNVEIETSPRVTISVGVSSWDKTEELTSLQSLFKKADEGLYTAKESGKNQVVVN
ncbi:sensor domain-containing diguanylate cyclase [Halalkalibacter akibai]|uniref:GGDEF domain protein n=1 Tax=Halalkalibacter akibai (strain ATCC 43226 / DSM 21942 / CIP 109018 / JCM 9157 / 1139) TaxID=1236973 RepID=W4QS39_HALA3|nr:diguanylate cyclase [Halalkalibacter akibai]GAE34159.1 GGDEF domain protein [Halalkalibacter akibai JCM 9157]